MQLDNALRQLDMLESAAVDDRTGRSIIHCSIAVVRILTVGVLIYSINDAMLQRLFIIPAKAREYVFTAVGLSVCVRL